MKELIVILSIIAACFVSVLCQANNYIVIYDYDAAGNRISRQCVLVPFYASSPKKTDSTKVVEVLGDLKITIYPNPTRGIIEVGLSTYDPKVSVNYNLFTSEGKLIVQISAQSDRTLIDLSAYPAGWFLLRATTKEKEILFKIIKQ
jgi:hypothetical protein